MNATLLLLLLLGAFLAINVPIALALGASAVIVGFLLQGNIDFLATILFSSLQKVELLAIPFFILAGNVLDKCGIMARLFALVDSLVGRVRGSTGLVASGLSVMVSGLSGSGPADTAALAVTMGPAMRERGYPSAYTAALVAAGAGLAIVVPPSIAFILYGVAVPGVSIGDMFVAGVIPGIVMGALIGLANYIVCVRRNYDPEGKPFKLAIMLRALRGAVWGLVAPVVIVGGIYFGIVTPTEAAGIAVVYGLLVGLVIHREISLRDLVGIIRLTVGDTAAVMLIVACSSVFAWVITIDGTVVSWVADFASSATAHWQVFLMAGVVLLVAGLFLDGASIYLVIIPLLMPAVRALGIDLVWFGIFVAIAIGAGQFTPPVGVNLFVASRVLGVSLERVVGETGPFLLAALVGLVLVYLFPALSTWLPSMMP